MSVHEGVCPVTKADKNVPTETSVTDKLDIQESGKKFSLFFNISILH